MNDDAGIVGADPWKIQNSTLLPGYLLVSAEAHARFCRRPEEEDAEPYVPFVNTLEHNVEQLQEGVAAAIVHKSHLQQVRHPDDRWRERW